MNNVRFLNRVPALQLIVESELGSTQGSSEGTRHRGLVVVAVLHRGPESEAAERTVWTGPWLIAEPGQSFHDVQEVALHHAGGALAAAMIKLLEPWEGESPFEEVD